VIRYRGESSEDGKEAHDLKTRQGGSSSLSPKRRFHVAIAAVVFDLLTIHEFNGRL